MNKDKYDAYYDLDQLNDLSKNQSNKKAHKKKITKTLCLINKDPIMINKQ